VIWILPWWYFTPQFREFRSRITAVLVVGGGAVFLACLSSFFDPGEGSTEAELGTILEERKRIEERLEEAGEPDLFTRLDLNLNQISEYYTINKGQARSSFRFGVLSSVVGLIALLSGIGMFFFGSGKKVAPAALSSVGGLLAQFIGASALYMYRKSMDQLNIFFDRLARLQDTMLSILLCDQISDSELQNTVRHELIQALIARAGAVGSVLAANFGAPPKRRRRTLSAGQADSGSGP
jgi:hypothetical protein